MPSLSWPLVVLLALAAAGAGYAVRWYRAHRSSAGVRSLAAAQIESQEQPCWVADLPEGTLHASAGVRDLVGERLDSIRTIYQLIEELGHPEEGDRLREVVDEFLTGRRAFAEGEFRMLCADGAYHRISLRAAVSWGTGGRPSLLTGSLLDLTRTREVEEERDRLFNLSVDLLGISDFEGYLQQVNPAWVRVLRWSRDDIMSRPLAEFIHAEDRVRFQRYQTKLRAGETVRELEARARCRDGSYRWISWSSFPLPDRQRVFTVARDVTEKKEAEERLQAYQERLRNLASELATVEDRERRHLAEVLHDSLAQDLFAAKTKAQLLRTPDRLPDPGCVLEEVVGILDEAMLQTRSLTVELFPPVLYEVGLDAALEWLCRSFRATRGLNCEFSVEGESEDLPQDLRALSFRIVRELLNNVVKHAEASVARLAVAYRDGHLQVAVDDDGPGFDLDGASEPPLADREDVPQRGFGLFSIRERLRSLQGNLAITPSPLGGWRVVMTLPLPRSSD